MALRGVKPEAKEKRLKLFLYGPAGVGKTTAVIQFPNAYVIDTEKGSDFYSKTLSRSGSVVFQSNNPDEIKEEIKELLTTKHPYKTLIIDPVTNLYNAVQEKWTRVFEKHTRESGKTEQAEIQDFGMRYWGRVKSEFKSIQRMLMALDMNVLVTSHQKDQYGAGMTKVGVTYDSIKGEDYLYDLVFRLAIQGGKRMAITEKERAEVGLNKFPESFEWGYDNFLKFYGKEVIERESTPIKMASAEQINKIKNLVEIVKVEADQINGWFQKAGVDDWSEMQDEQIQKAIDFLDKKLKAVK